MTTTAPPHPRSRWLPAAGLAALGLLGCNAGGTTPGSPPADAPTALVYGPVSSPVLDELGRRVRLVQHTGSQRPEDHDLVVLDGDAHPPQKLRTDAFVASAVRSGSWVLAVDVEHDHKRDGLGQLLGFATHGASPGYLARKTLDANGRPRVSVLEHPTSGTTITQTTAGAAGARVATPSPSGAASFVNAVMAELGTGAARPQAAAPAFPVGLQYATFSFREPVDYTSPAAAKKAGATQAVHYEVNYTVYVILNNGGSGTGDFQYVAVEMEGQANPTGGSGAFANMAADEKAWFQGYFGLSVRPAADFAFSPVASGPQTTSGAGSVTSDAGFAVGYQGQNGSASYAYANPQTRSLTDWAVSDQGSGNAAAWRYVSRAPLDWDRPGSGSVFSSSGYPEDPGDLATSTLRLHAQAVWRTDDLKTGYADFEYRQEHGLAETYCARNAGAVCAQAGPVQGSVNASGGSFSVNLAAVVPVNIRSLTFAPNPARAGQAVTGTITLEDDAQVDTAVALSSSGPNVTVPPRVTVPRGQTSATFKVLTSGNGLAPGGSTVAAVTALYANNAQVQLAVVAPPPTVAGGRFHSCATTVGGKVVCWGAKNDGRINAGQASPPADLEDALEVSAGGFHSCAVAAGAARCWGGLVAPALAGASWVTSGYLHACAVQAGGTVACWGADSSGDTSPPAGLSGVVGVSAGFSHTCALKDDGTVACWGFSGYGESTPPAGLSGVKGVSSGNRFACALKSDSTVVCWGSQGSAKSAPPAWLSGATSLGAGYEHACALLGDFSVTCWGSNAQGQTSVPQAVQGNAVGLGVGALHSCAVLRNGTVTCWGDNSYGQLNVPTGLNLLQP